MILVVHHFRRPHLSLDLPYINTDTDTDPFPAVPRSGICYAHQVIIVQRLQTEVYCSAVIGTGANSSKAECIQLPILS